MELTIDYVFIKDNITIPNLPEHSLVIGMPHNTSAMLINNNSKLENINVDYFWIRKQNDAIVFSGDNIPIDGLDEIYFCTNDGHLWNFSKMKKYPDNIDNKILVIRTAHLDGTRVRIHVDPGKKVIIVEDGTEREFSFTDCYVLVKKQNIDHCKYVMNVVKLS